MFLAMMAITTALCTIFWQAYVSERLYDCTDAIGLDYLHPGDWVHGHVAVVHQVVHGRSMSEPDTIKEGWSVGRLWLLWLAFFAGSLIVSIGFALIPWVPKRTETAN